MSAPAIPGVTSIPAVKSALETLLNDALDIPVVRGKEDSSAEDYVAIWEGRARREHAGLRGGASTAPLDEFVDIKIVIEALSVGEDDYAGAETSAYAYFAAAEAAIRTDLTLGGAWLFDRISEVEDNFFRLDKARGCRLFVTVSGKARI